MDFTSEGIIALFTIGLAVFTFLLWRATVRLAKSAEDTAQKQLRAYISAQANYLFFFGTSTRLQARYEVRNHGHTPAYKISDTAGIDILPYPLPDNFSLQEHIGESSISHVLHPNAAINGHVTASRLFSQQEIDDVVYNNGRRIYIFGRVTYEDLSGEERFTEFCSSVSGPAVGLISQNHAVPTVEINFEIVADLNQAN